MKNRIQDSFDEIRADKALLDQTAAYLYRERKKREHRKSPPPILRWVGALAAMMVLAVGILGYNLYFTAAAYISIDVSPSVELTLNRMDRVIGSYAFNPDGEWLLQEVDLKGKKYDDALNILITHMKQDGYFSEDPLVAMTVQTQSGEKEQALCDTLRQSVGTQVNALQLTADIEIFPVSAEIRGTAHGCHMSPAKYLAIQELLEVDETSTLEQYSQSSVQQIRQRTQQCREEHSGMAGSGGKPGNMPSSFLNNQGPEHGHRQGHGRRHSNP